MCGKKNQYQYRGNKHSNGSIYGETGFGRFWLLQTKLVSAAHENLSECVSSCYKCVVKKSISISGKQTFKREHIW